MSALKRLGELGRAKEKRGQLLEQFSRNQHLILPIDEASLKHSPEKICQVVAGYMLIPDDPASRYWYSFKEKFGNLLGFASKHSLKNCQELAEIRELSKIRKEVPDFASYLPGKELERAGPFGLISGLILRDFVEFNLTKTNKKTLKDINTYWAKIFNDSSISVSTINNIILPKFKPVSHLWAAHCIIYQEHGDKELPCVPENLPRFLSISEQYRKLGETIFPKRRQRSFLDHSITLKVPPDIKIPRIQISRLEN